MIQRRQLMRRVTVTFGFLFSTVLAAVVTVVVMHVMEKWLGFWPTFAIAMAGVIYAAFRLSGSMK